MNNLSYITTDPPNAGVMLVRQDGKPLGQSEMYMRNNFRIPSTSPDGFEVVVPGRELEVVTLTDLSGFGSVEMVMVLECAGNGRILMNPIPDGTPWDLGGASVIEVAGVRLAEVLGELPEDIVDVVFTGADSGEVEPEGPIRYQFSVPRAMALSSIPLLVTHIGGEPLSLDHGAPVRLVVPGHFAMKSVKWLTTIEALAQPFEGHFVKKYRYFEDVEEPEAAPVGAMQVRSIIASPADGDTIERGAISISGSAWTGTGDVIGVEVSLDEGQTWTDAAIDDRSGASIRWSLTVDARPGLLTATARASDSNGATQPVEPRWNRNGYANNVAHRVSLEIT